jgi:phosphopantothenoylcysteine synthetase/decarboxylase
MRVLVTAGGTEEPLDGVRRLTNFSTGATGGVLARVFAERGAEVLLLHAERATLEDVSLERESFLSFAELEGALRRLLGERSWDVVVHAAAVGDYRVVSLEVDGRPVCAGGRGKIGTAAELLIRLRPNPKLIDSLRSWSRNPDLRVVGFKLTDDPDTASREDQVRALLARGVADLVVHNDLSEIDRDRHMATIYSPEGVVARAADKRGLAGELYRLLNGGGRS